MVASLCVGHVAEIDYSDASGMNMLELKEKTWCEAVLAAVSAGILEGNVHGCFLPQNIFICVVV